MDKMVIAPELQTRLRGLTEQLFLSDDAGETLGVVLPPKLYAEMLLAWMSREPTTAELDAARAEYKTRGGKSTPEVLAHLAEVRRRWEAGQGRRSA